MPFVKQIQENRLKDRLHIYVCIYAMYCSKLSVPSVKNQVSYSGRFPQLSEHLVFVQITHHICIS